MSCDTVHILAWRLLDFDGRDLTYGGLQRWLLEAARLLVRGGCEVVVHQRANRAFERELEPGLLVHGYRIPARAWGSPWFNLTAHRAIPADAPVIYMVEDLAYPVCRKRSLVVQHGIWWDGEYGWWKVRAAEHITRHAVRRSAATVCVDTNFVNWFRARWPDAGCDHKLHFVPNFINAAAWGPQPELPAAAATRDGRITLCFPRRSEPRRGIHLMADVTPRLARRFPRLDFRFLVGSGYHTTELENGLRSAGLPQSRYSIEVLPFDAMRPAYEQSAIVTIPTLCGEGTSLAAIEAMYFGCAIVATWVGGLANLIRDGRNGLLIAPRAEALEAAIARLVEDPSLRHELGTNAMDEAADLYGVDRWRRGISAILSAQLGLPEACRVGA